MFSSCMWLAEIPHSRLEADVQVNCKLLVAEGSFHIYIHK
jgi:hypothetical protein